MIASWVGTSEPTISAAGLSCGRADAHFSKAAASNLQNCLLLKKFPEPLEASSRYWETAALTADVASSIYTVDIPMLKLRGLNLFTGAMIATLSLESALAAGGRPYGNWSMGKVTVNVTDCDGKLCGTIVALKEPISKIDGKPKVDRKNPDSAMRQRPLIGLAVLMGMNPAGDGKWQGIIYDPEDGKTYNASIKVAGDTLKVEGCVGGIFCKTHKFVRVN